MVTDYLTVLPKTSLSADLPCCRQIVVSYLPCPSSESVATNLSLRSMVYSQYRGNLVRGFESHDEDL